ncbi:MAG: PQQ-dependent sugar dehydrogenase, partial [Verrucomicrobiales bacterium]|nr:PQQ-dependent sugar dehydrogenase [Verrucomicrobiales bacterium]
MARAEFRIVDPVPRRVGLWLVVWAGLAALGGEPVRGAESRPLWRNDRLVGSPEPPLPYGVERVLGHVAWRNPMYVAPEPGTDGLWVVLQGGEPDRPSRIVRVRQSEGSDQPEPVLTIPGRLVYSVAFHPGYRTNRQFFVFSNGPTGASDRTNRISRFAAPEGREGAVDPASEIPVLSFFSAGHDGGDMAFGNDGMLFVTTGDGSSDSDTYDSGQDMSRLLAKVLRIDVDLSTSAPGYRVPKDNPFVDRPGMRPETWAYGFRNPWRMSIDERTGDLWVGQNGQDLWETAHRVGRGENMGWSVFEGNHPFHAQRRRGPTPIVPPTIEHPHSEFRSLTGGVVYYGDALPGLVGTYVYGDYATGRIWGARMVDGVLAWHRELADTSLQIAAFRVDARGQLLVVDHGGGIYRLVPRPPSDGKNGFPTKLSETGLFASVRDHRVASGLVPYSIRAAGWADGAVADRFVALPGEARIEYAPTRGWGFPDGTALVQTLSIETVVGFPESRRRVETRVLLRQENEWAGYTYRWDPDQSEARLVSKEGATVDLAIREASGGTRRQAWKIPSRTECLTCHSRAANFVLGLSTVQMARGAGESDSELERFVAATL